MGGDRVDSGFLSFTMLYLHFFVEGLSLNLKLISSASQTVTHLQGSFSYLLSLEGWGDTTGTCHQTHIFTWVLGICACTAGALPSNSMFCVFVCVFIYVLCVCVACV